MPWHDLGPAEQFASRTLTPALIGNTKVTITCVGGEFGALSGVCNHAGGPLADGRVDGDYVVCPWHKARRPARASVRGATTRRAPMRARGPARSHRWTHRTRWIASTKRSCIGQTSFS